MNTINFQKFAVDEQTREITFSCASEMPCMRYDQDLGYQYQEILLIDGNSVDLSRLNNYAPVLFNHDANALLGVVNKAFIADGKVYVRVQFSKNSDFAERIYKDILDGVIKNVSIGYCIEKFQDINEDGIIKRYAYKWLIYETSIVSIPADDTVGIRSFNNSKTLNIKENNMANKSCGEEPKQEVKEMPSEEVMTQAEIQALIAENAELKEKLNAIEEAKKEEIKEEIKEEVTEEKSTPEVDEETKEEIEKIGEDFGVDKEEIERAINKKLTVREFVKTNINIQHKKGQKMEREFTSYLKERNFDKPFIMRDFTGFSPSQLVGTTKLNLVDILEKKMGLKGFRTLNGLNSNISIPVQTGRNTIYTPGINEASTDSNPTFTSRSLSPVKFVGSTEIGKEMLVNSNDDVQAFIVDSITRELAYKVEDYLLSKVTSGAGNTVTYSAISAITWDDILSMEAYLGSYNLQAIQFVMSPAARAALKGIAKAQNVAAKFICEDNEINGYPCNVSGCVSNDNIFFGDFDQLVAAFWGPGLEIIVDPYTEARSGAVVVTGSVCMDAAVLNADAFVVGKVQTSSSSAE